MKSLFRLHNYALVLVILPLLQSCAVVKMFEHGTMREPTLDFQDYKISDVTLNHINIDILFKAHNPNFYDIDTFFVDYEFFISEQSFAAGKDVKVTLIPEGTTDLTIPLEIAYDKLLSTANVLADLIRQRQKQAKGKLHIDIHGEYLIIEIFGRRYTRPYNYSVDVPIDIPLPEITMDTIRNTVKSTLNNIVDFGFGLFDKKEPQPTPTDPAVTTTPLPPIENATPNETPEPSAPAFDNM